MIETFSATDLQAKQIPPILWVISGLLAQGLTILAGAPKAGKSWLALDLCVSVARCDGFWGHETTPMPGTVLYLALEDSDRRLKARLETVLDGRECPDNLRFSTAAPTLDRGLADHMRELLDFYPDTRLVVIDTLGRVRTASRLDGYQRDYQELATLKAIADEQGAAIVAVHHLRKAGGDPFDRISGTNGVFGAADAAWVLTRERQSSEGKLAVVGRDFDEAELVLNFSDSCRWTLVSDDAKAHRFAQDPLVQFLSTTDSFVGFGEELAAQFMAFCAAHSLPHGLSETSPQISFSKRLHRLSGDLWRCRKSLTTKHTSKGSLLTIASL